MFKSIRFIKSVYRAAALIDAIVAAGMVEPRIIQPTLGMAALPVSPEVRYALNNGAALMFGWTALLVWASVDPIGRRGVLLLTAFPVIAGLALAAWLGAQAGYIPIRGAIRVWILQGLLTTGIGLAYRSASSLARS